jgi:hypothetical protein
MRVIWIIWCLGWAGFWTFTLLGGNPLAFFLAPLSLLAILIPIGKKTTIVIRDERDKPS